MNLYCIFDPTNKENDFFIKTSNIMKTIIIHHVNEDFTEETIETIVMRGGCIVSIHYSETQTL